MDHYAGIDVSLEHSSVCVVDATGRIVCEAKVTSEPEALVAFLSRLNLPLARIGLEAGPLSQWLQAALVRAGFEAILLETRHVKAALSAMVVKTDRKDARGIAQLLRMGWVRPVHGRAQAAAGQDARRGAQLAGSPTWLRPQGWRDQQGTVCGPRADAGVGSRHAGTDRRGDAAGA